jgi:hypothetical protein
VRGRIQQYSEQNSMTMSNLAIVFGPTLFGAQTAMTVDGHTNGGPVLSDATLQNKVRSRRITVLVSFADIEFPQAIETILEHYVDIFVDESEEA